VGDGTVRLRGFGLRPRLLGALVLTAVVTLGVAALALLSPLEARLQVDGENSVLAAVSATKAEFGDVHVDPGTGQPDPTELQAQAFALRRRAGGGAQVVVLDSQMNVICCPGPTSLGPDVDVPDNYSDVRHALTTGRGTHMLVGDELLVAQPIHIGGRSYGLAVRRRLQYVSSAVHVVRTAFLEAAAAGLVIALLLGIGLTRTLLRRLERLRDATRELEREGMDARPPADGHRDEIGELTRAFASMHSQLRHQESARRAFVATASHELRTPLTSLDGMLELLEDDLNADNLDLVDARKRTAHAKEQSHRLSALASDLLDLSRMDARLDLRREPLELGEVCRAVAAEFELRAAGSQVRLDVRQAPSACWVSADPGAVARIIRILLDNAVRVSPPGSTIYVELAGRRGWATATVVDEGPGVAADERELIFERFQRGSATAGRAGFGLGLAIGRELAPRIGGALDLEDAPPSEPDAASSPNASSGARFTLRLATAEIAGENGA